MMKRTVKILLFLALTGAMPLLRADNGGINLATSIVNLVSASVSVCSTIVNKCSSSKSEKPKEEPPAQDKAKTADKKSEKAKK